MDVKINLFMNLNLGTLDIRQSLAKKALSDTLSLYTFSIVVLISRHLAV